MAKIQTCDNWLAQLLACAILMIYGNSVHISTQKKTMCDIWKAKMFSVIFCQLQTTVSIVECQIFQSTYFPNNIYTNLHLLVAIRYYYFLVQQKIISNSIPWLKTTQHHYPYLFMGPGFTWNTG